MLTLFAKTFLKYLHYYFFKIIPEVSTIKNSSDIDKNNETFIFKSLISTVVLIYLNIIFWLPEIPFITYGGINKAKIPFYFILLITITVDLILFFPVYSIIQRFSINPYKKALYTINIILCFILGMTTISTTIGNISKPHPEMERLIREIPRAEKHFFDNPDYFISKKYDPEINRFIDDLFVSMDFKCFETEPTKLGWVNKFEYIHKLDNEWYIVIKYH